MSKYIFKRLLMMIPTLLGAAIFVFFLLRMIPGDVCELRLAGTGLYADPAEILLCQKNLGLDQPLFAQFIDFIVGYAKFDLGISMWTGSPITEEIGLRFELSLQVAIMATLIARKVPIDMMMSFRLGCHRFRLHLADFHRLW